MARPGFIACWRLAGMALVLAGPGLGLLNAAEPRHDPPTAEQIREAIRQLGDPDYPARERASEWLWGAGRAAEPALREALFHKDPEVVFRAQQILARFRLGLYSGTPDELVRQIRRFHFANHADRERMCAQLAVRGDYALLRRLMNLVADRGLSSHLEQRFADPIAKALKTKTLADGEYDALERMLRGTSHDEHLRDYAALLLACNTIHSAAAALTAQQMEYNEGVAAWKRLACLLRAEGNWTEALAAAKHSGDRRLIEQILIDARMWSEVVQIQGNAYGPRRPGRSQEIEKMGYLATFLRLAGNTSAFEQMIPRFLILGRDADREASLVTEVLLINERFEDAIDHTHRQDLLAEFKLLCALHRFAEAFREIGFLDPDLPASEWLARGPHDKPEDGLARFALGVEVAGTRVSLGQRERAQEMLAALAAATEQADPAQRRTMLLSLVKLEIKMGLDGRADEHAAALLDGPRESRDDVWAALYGQESELAGLWWQALRNDYRDEPCIQTLRRLKRMLSRRTKVLSAEQITSWADRLEAMEADSEPAAAKDDDQAFPLAGLDMADHAGVSTGPPSPDQKARRRLAVAQFCWKRGYKELATLQARRAVEVAPSPGELLLAGDQLVRDRQWAEAAKAYSAAWGKDPRNASALYLMGVVNMKQGETAQGLSQMQTALIVPLGDMDIRLQLAQTLQRFGLVDELLRQCDWATRLGDWNDARTATCFLMLGNAASARGEHLRAADCWERFLLANLDRNRMFAKVEDYLTVTMLIHKSRGRGLLKSGKASEAIAEFHLAEQARPGEIQLIIDVVQELEKAGHQAEADAMFRRAADLYEETCRDFPQSAPQHNQLARLAVSLGRKLDNALVHAIQAVELDRRNPAYLDTLAETLFRRGDLARAIRVERLALKASPGNRQVQRQLQRFEAAEAAASKP